MNKFMNLAKSMAENGVKNCEGGPFGCVIINSDNEVISTGNNKVIINNDPTAHAEIVAIRNACKKLNTYDLSGLILYTSCEPCPMCLSAIIWSNIKTVYYACTKNDAANIGFRDDAIYNYLQNRNTNLLNLQQIDRDECMALFNDYQKNKKIIY